MFSIALMWRLRFISRSDDSSECHLVECGKRGAIAEYCSLASVSPHRKGTEELVGGMICIFISHCVIPRMPLPPLASYVGRGSR
jgi:hypothetical protein